MVYAPQNCVSIGSMVSKSPYLRGNLFTGRTPRVISWFITTSNYRILMNTIDTVFDIYPKSTYVFRSPKDSEFTVGDVPDAVQRAQHSYRSWVRAASDAGAVPGRDVEDGCGTWKWGEHFTSRYPKIPKAFLKASRRFSPLRTFWQPWRKFQEPLSSFACFHGDLEGWENARCAHHTRAEGSSCAHFLHQ
jgi:hypothetical protein